MKNAHYNAPSTLLVYSGEDFRGTIETTVGGAYGRPGTGNPREEGLISKAYRLGKRDIGENADILVCARPQNAGGSYTFFTPEGSIIESPADYFRTGRNY